MQNVLREWGPKTFWYVGAKKRTHIMTTNNLSLKSHVLTEKDLGLPIVRSPSSCLQS